MPLQHDALRSAGCASVHEDKLSGVALNRPGLVAALGSCRPGDVLHVWKLDRLGRSMAELVEDVKARVIFGVFAAFSEFERELIRERTKAGMQAARRRGKHIGFPVILTPEKLDLARRLIAEGKGRSDVARMVGVALRWWLNAKL